MSIRLASLWVFAGNEQGRRFYKAMGCSPDGASRMLVPDPTLEAVRYRKELPDPLDQGR